MANEVLFAFLVIFVVTAGIALRSYFAKPSITNFVNGLPGDTVKVYADSGTTLMNSVYCYPGESITFKAVVVGDYIHWKIQQDEPEEDFNAT